ncbi:hypothetical protein [Roseovarius sp. SYSU LYC5161]|uniref:hypothetical protein n=1 Tax=Roseovarius halophilus (ex Wu et al. 2025) TaxID=3376060 RepID=UPI00399BE08D
MTGAEAQVALRRALARLGQPDPGISVPEPLEAPEDWLFETLCALTRTMAQEAEATTRQTWPRRFGKHRPTIDDDYSRRTWIEAHERLMAHLRQDWGARLHHHYKEMLARYPLTPQERANARRLGLSTFGLTADD